MRRQNLPLQQEYRDLAACESVSSELGSFSRDCGGAAALPVRYRLRTPDALQIATALEAGSQALLCIDTELRRISELRVLVVDDLEFYPPVCGNFSRSVLRTAGCRASAAFNISVRSWLD